MSDCRLAIIADDLSGALDASAPFAARGADARVVLRLEVLAETLEAWQGQWPAVIAVNTASRHLLAEEAALRVNKAVCLLERVQPQQWFKKIDSTLRGQVVAECRALREALDRPLLLAPAVPTQGRVVRKAEVWVDGVLLKDTAYQQDACSRPLIGPIDAAFAASGLALQRYRPGQPTPLPSDDCIADAESDDALLAIDDAAFGDGVSRVLAGAAGLTEAIAQRCFGAADAALRSLDSVNAVLYAIGSRSPRAAEQLRQLCQHVPDLAVVEANGETAAARCARPGNSATLDARVVVPGSSVTQRSASQVAEAMAVQAASIIATWQENAESLLFLTGGDIAMAVLAWQGARYINVEAEWAPGVALGYVGGDPLRRVMTKAGGFGEAPLLARLHCQFQPMEGHCRDA